MESLSDVEIDQATAVLPGETITAGEVRQASKEAQREPISQWYVAWSEDFKKGQAKEPEYYMNKYDPSNDLETEANRAHLAADQARACQAQLQATVDDPHDPELEQARIETLNAQERERVAQNLEKAIGPEAAKAAQIKEVSFPESAHEGIKRSSRTGKVRQAKVFAQSRGRSR